MKRSSSRRLMPDNIRHDGKPWSKLALADLNHDSKLDLLGTNSKPEGLMARLGFSDGTFGPVLTSLTNGGRISSFGAALGDLNGDGHLDLVAPDYGSSHLDVMLGVGDGTFTCSTASIADAPDVDFFCVGRSECQQTHRSRHSQLRDEIGNSAAESVAVATPVVAAVPARLNRKAKAEMARKPGKTNYRAEKSTVP